MERVLGSPKVRSRISAYCVGLAACCDPPDVEPVLLEYFSAKFPDAKSLPFGVFLTHDFEYVHGFTGARTVEQFLEDLDAVEASPLFPATAEDAERLAKLGAEATEHAAAGRWDRVLKLGREGAAIRGRCDERTALDVALRNARAFAEERFGWVQKQVAEADDLDAVNEALREVQRLFKGEEEAETAQLGLKAVKDAVAVRRTAERDEDAAEAQREKARETYAGTRWTALFYETF